MDPLRFHPALLARMAPLKGPMLTMALLAGFPYAPAPLQHTDVFAGLLGLNTAYSALSGGVGSAIATYLLTLGYFLVTHFDPAQPFGYSAEHLARLAVLAVTLPVGIWMILSGKAKAELAARLKAERDAALAHAHRLEVEVERRVAELGQASTQQHELERFRELDRLKGLFVNAVSHELRTPLTSIVGYVEFLEDGIGGPLTPLQIDYLEQIHRSSRQLRRLVDDLLDFARLETGSFKLTVEPADLADKTRRVVTSLRPQVLEAGQRLEVDVPSEPVWALVDAERLDQVMLNLLSNALKFTPRGGHIQVRLVTVDGMACWSVKDTGVGIDPGQLGNLFHPYSRIETGLGVKGTGLGLSISKTIIEAHGGEIGVESTPGEGSTFWFRVPLMASGPTVHHAELSPQAL